MRHISRSCTYLNRKMEKSNTNYKEWWKFFVLKKRPSVQNIIKLTESVISLSYSCSFARVTYQPCNNICMFLQTWSLLALRRHQTKFDGNERQKFNAKRSKKNANSKKKTLKFIKKLFNIQWLTGQLSRITSLLVISSHRPIGRLVGRSCFRNILGFRFSLLLS